MASLILFAFLVLIYILISDIITILFRLTGMTEDAARFQVVSLLTNSGFTTKASEAIMSSRKRMRLARATRLFGYVFTISIVSTMVNFFMSLGKAQLNSIIIMIPIIVAVMLVFNYFRHSTAFKTKFDHKIEQIGNRIMFGKDVNPVVIMEDYGDTVLANVLVNKVPEIIDGVQLSESCLMSEYNIMVVLIKNRSGEAKQAKADSVLHKNDIITCMGRLKDIKAVFGKAEHKAKVKGET